MSRRSARARRNRARRGRPRDVGAPRTASGRKSRARRPPEDPRAVALAARRRVLGLSAKLAGHEKAATVLGRLWLGGDVDQALCDAGERYLEIHSEAMRALKAPMGLAVSGVVGSAGDQVSKDYVAWARRAVERYSRLKNALLAVGSFAMVHRVVIEDQPLPDGGLTALTDGLKMVAQKLRVR
jgi:hypothetical protein